MRDRFAGRQTYPVARIIPRRVDQPTPPKAPEDWRTQKPAGQLTPCGIFTLVPRSCDLPDRSGAPRRSGCRVTDSPDGFILRLIGGRFESVGQATDDFPADTTPSPET
jgi:hypothetical protein